MEIHHLLLLIVMRVVVVMVALLLLHHDDVLPQIISLPHLVRLPCSGVHVELCILQ